MHSKVPARCRTGTVRRAVKRLEGCLRQKWKNVVSLSVNSTGESTVVQSSNFEQGEGVGSGLFVSRMTAFSNGGTGTCDMDKRILRGDATEGERRGGTKTWARSKMTNQICKKYEDTTEDNISESKPTMAMWPVGDRG